MRIHHLDKTGKQTYSYVIILLLVALVAASAPGWVGDNVDYQAPEDNTYYHNLSKNITGFNNDVTFAIDTVLNNISWTNASGTYQILEPTITNWVKIINATSGNLSINATYDNQTGYFEIPIQAKNTTSNESTTVIFEFMVNATNDNPNFTISTTEYNLSEGSAFNEYVNMSDEEAHYPLITNLTFIANCTHAAWTGRNTGENCSIINATAVNNVSALLSITPTTNEVGTYWAWMSAYDAGDQYVCPHAYCVNATYNVNQTSSTSIVVFNVLSTLTLNVSACTGQTLTEGTPFSCLIDVRTKKEDSTFNASSYADFGNGYGGPVSNRSWFYENATLTAANFSYTINVSLTPTKREVGNWSINFNAFGEDNLKDVETIDLFVNWTEDNVTLDAISDLTIYENTSFTVNATDPDLLVQDKNTKNEVLTFDSNTSWVSISDTETISGNNYTTATITVNYDAISSSGEANHSVRINVTDTGGSNAERIFTIEILNDTKAEWNLSKSNVSLSNESDNVYINLSEYVSDAEGDSLTFSYVNDTPFDNFNLTSAGIINFTSTNADVGTHVVTINASDGKLDSLRGFNFTIYNVLDNITIESPAPTITVAEDNNSALTLNVYDNDFLIPTGQKSFYNETLTLNITFDNLTSVVSAISYGYNLSVQSGNLSTYLANFTPIADNIGEYNVTINITDAGGLWNLTYYTLNITAVNDEPNLSTITNQTVIINSTLYLDINATDEEDSPTLPENGNLTYTITNLTNGGEFLTINSTTGVINFTVNSSHVGTYKYNVTVNDTDGALDYQTFNVTIFGAPNITLPNENYIFNWSEGNATGNINFTVDYGVSNTTLTYQLYLDRIVYTNTTDYSYTTLIDSGSLRNETNHTWQSNTNFTWNFTPGYDDETYNLEKNLTLIIFNPDYPNLNDTVNWKVNITHTNQNITFNGTISDKGPVTAGTTISVNLSEYFTDNDYWDKKDPQTVNFTINTISGSGFVKAASSIGSDWILSLASPTATTETITITGTEYNTTNASIGNATSNSFEVEFTNPTTTSSPSSGGGSSGSGQKTVLQHFSLKVVVPQKVEISEENYIDIGFSIRNSGKVNLNGIALSSAVTYDGFYSDDINITLEQTYIQSLAIGESKDFTMRLFADTQKSGRYKATVYANVTSPKFSDWGDFFIDLNEINDSEARQLLVFTEKLVTENPECIELNENLEEARLFYKEQDYELFRTAANKIIGSCEDAIQANEQIRYPLSFAQDNFYYISFATLIIFFTGFIFYVYKRVRFNKYRVDEYIGGEHV